MAEMPSGTVTFLFSDVERSTELLERHGAAMGGALARHHELFEQIVERHGGAIFETVGDAVYAAFSNAGAAGAAALDAQRALASEDWGAIGRLAVRIALHTGAVERRGDHYFGPALFRVARLQALGYGEQTLLSGVTARLAADALPAGASLRDLGTHRLKDLGEPEHVFQLIHPDLRSAFPALKSLDAHPHNLPLQLSSFVGREAQLAEVDDLLADQRLVTLLGPGGVGKTRLALQVAAEQLQHFADGAWFVDLAAIRDPELVPGAIATALGLREQPGTSMAATLAEHLRPKGLLLVLDNLEQLLPAAAASVGELLAAAPHLRILATSRAPLRLRGEREYPVAPLPVGDPDHFEPEPTAAVALFLERVRAIRPEFEFNRETGPLIAAVCARLDGLPLAIELAAARLRALSLAQLHDRLAKRLPLLSGGDRDLPERQQTLRDAIAWSTELLNEPERRLFARQGVFVGRFTLEAVEAVAGPGLGIEVLDGMNALLEHSLVRHFDDVNDEPRYTMLETIREYATEQLEASGEAERIRGAHTGHLLALAERARREIEGARQQAWYRRLDEALGDLRAAFAFAQAAALDEEVLRFGPALYPYWSSRGLLHDFRSWAAIAEPRLHRGSPLTRANALHAIGFIRATDADLTGAESMYREAATVRRKFGDVDGALSSLNNIGTIHLDRGDYTAAEDVLRECLALQPDSPHATANLGECALELGKDSEAQELFETALRIFRERGDAESEVFTISELARLALAQGDVPGADRLLAEARRLVERQADSGLPRMIDLLEAQLLMQTGRLSEARMKAIRSLEFVYQGKYPRGIAEALDVLGEAALRDMDPGVAGRLWGCLESLLAATGLSFSPRRLRQRSELIGSLGPAIAPGVLEDAMAQGRLLDLDSAVRLAEAADEPLDSAAAPDSSSPLS